MPKTTDFNLKFFDRDDFESIQSFIQETKSYHGNYSLHLTDENIERIKEGKCLVWGMGEYTVLIYFKDVQALA